MKPKNKSSANIPTTGRIRRLAKSIVHTTNLSVAQKVMKDFDRFESMKDYVVKAEWIKKAIERLENLVDKKTCFRIMENCGRKCCGLTYRKHAKQFISESKSIEEFLYKLNKRGIGGGRFKLEDRNTIVGGYDKCYCGQVKQTKEPFPTNTYCQCGVDGLSNYLNPRLKNQLK